MKTFLMSLLMAGFAMLSFTSADHSTPTAPPKIIARFDKVSNGFVVNEDILRKTFTDGSKIERFSIQKDGDDFFLIRRGIDAKKMYRSEAIPLKMVDKGILVLPIKLKWYTVCSSMSCWCHKVGNSCDCADGGNCFFGTVPIDDDIEIIVIA